MRPSHSDLRLLLARQASASSEDSGSWPTESRARLKAFIAALGLFAGLGVGIDLAGPSLFGLDPMCCAMATTLHGLLLALSMGLYFLLHQARISWSRMLDLASGFVVVCSLAVAFAEQGHIHSEFSFVGFLLLLFPLFVPTHVGRTLLTALAGATALPVAMGVFASVLGEDIEPRRWVAVAVTYIVALVSVVPAKIVWAMSKAVRRAQRLGSYELVEPIGDGAMGEVWRAKHQLLRRPAAIKLIRPERLGDEDRRQRVLERFEREAQATASLESTHTVQLYDYGISADGVLFHVMELLRGINLETLVEEHGPLPPERVVHLLLQICDSLADAHRAGLVHRDIKPANIFLARKGRRVDYIKVLDFGLVKERRSGTEGSLTGETEVAGTPAYLAPEVAVGDSDIDGRADLYALGCVAYWLLTGERVFDGNTPMKVAVAHVTQIPERPSVRLGSPVPQALEDAIMACLEKDPNLRPRCAGELACRLERIRLRHDWTDSRARAWWMRNLPDLAEGLDTTPPAIAASA